MRWNSPAAPTSSCEQPLRPDGCRAGLTATPSGASRDQSVHDRQIEIAILRTEAVDDDARGVHEIQLTVDAGDARAACARRCGPARSTAARATVRRSPPTAIRAAGGGTARGPRAECSGRAGPSRRASTSAADNRALPRHDQLIDAKHRRVRAARCRATRRAISTTSRPRPPNQRGAPQQLPPVAAAALTRTSDRRKRLSAGTGMPGGRRRQPSSRGVRLLLMTSPPSSAARIRSPTAPIDPAPSVSTRSPSRASAAHVRGHVRRGRARRADHARADGWPPPAPPASRRESAPRRPA